MPLRPIPDAHELAIEYLDFAEPFAPVHRLRHTLRQVGCDPTEASDANHRGLGLDSNSVSAVLNHRIEGNVSETTYSYLTGLPKKRDTLQAIDDAIEGLTGAVR